MEIFKGVFSLEFSIKKLSPWLGREFLLFVK